MEHNLFLSYSSHDEDTAFQVRGWLDERDLRCWIAPKGISPGEIWADQIVRALRTSEVLLLLLSEHCIRSQHTFREVVLADQYGLEIIPIRISNTDLTDAWNYFLCDRQWRDAVEPPLESHMAAVAEAVRTVLDYRQRGRRFHEEMRKQVAESNLLLQSRLSPAKTPKKLPLRIPRSVISDQPSTFVEPFNALIPLIGRETDLKWLRGFRNAPEMFRWALVKGEGGMGKSRLAMEFCRECAEEGWQAGFLTKAELKRFVDSRDPEMWKPAVPVFAVVDYAAAKEEWLRDLIQLLNDGARLCDGVAGEQETPPVVRLLLLEREADRESGWLSSLMRAGEGEARVEIEQAFFGERLLMPPVIDDPVERFAATRKIVEATMAAWSERTGKPQPKKLHLRPDQWSRIQAATTNRPLYLQLAAIYACEMGDAQAMSHVSRPDLLEAAVDWELRYANRMCPEQEKLATAVNYLTGLLCLTGLSVIRQHDWYDCVRQELIWMGYRNIDETEVIETRDRIYPYETTGDEEMDRSAVQPDILAAAFCWRVFHRKKRSERHGFVNCCRRALEIGGIKAWPKLLRMVQDLQGLEEKLEEKSKSSGKEERVYRDVAREIMPLLEDRPFEEIDELANYIPERSVALAGIAEKLFSVLVERLRGKPEKRRRLAEILVKWSYSASERSRIEKDPNDTIKLGTEAVGLLEELASEDWDNHAPLLARAHHSLARSFDNLSQDDPEKAETLTHLDAAIAIRRELCQEAYKEHALDLADSLNNRSNYLAIVRRYDEALDVAREAVAIAEGLPRDLCSCEAARIARYYNVCGQRLAELGRHQEAVSFFEKSVARRRDQYHLDADVHAAPYALSLTSLYSSLIELGRSEDAFPLLDALVGCNRDLSARRPLPYLRHLAYWCLELADCHCEHGRTEEARRMVEDDAAHILDRHLLQPVWKVARESVRTCHAMANWLVEKGFRDSACDLLARAVEVADRYAKSDELADAEAKSEAERYADETLVRILELLIGAERGKDPAFRRTAPAAFLAWYEKRKGHGGKKPLQAVARVACWLARSEFDPKEPITSLRLYKVAAETYTDLSRGDDDPDLLLDRTESINDLSYVQMIAGDVEQARDYASRALELLDGFAGFRPNRFAVVHQNLLDTYAQVLVRLGELDKAAEAAGRALAICIEQKDNPNCALDEEEVMLSLFTKARIDLAAGRASEAAKGFREGVALSREVRSMSQHRALALQEEIAWFETHLPKDALEEKDDTFES
jgi:tetratricopeptide (TPR) repeat protein